jgi:hypothetical protein
MIYKLFNPSRVAASFVSFPPVSPGVIDIESFQDYSG